MTPDDAIRAAVDTSTRAARARATRPVPADLVAAVTDSRSCPDCQAGIVAGVECASCDGPGTPRGGLVTAADPQPFVRPTRTEILADPIAVRVYQVVTQYARMMLPLGGYAEARGYRDGATRAVIETCLALEAGARLRASLVAAAGDLALDDVYGPYGGGQLPVIDTIPAGLLPEVNPE